MKFVRRDGQVCYYLALRIIFAFLRLYVCVYSLSY